MYKVKFFCIYGHLWNRVLTDLDSGEKYWIGNISNLESGTGYFQILINDRFNVLMKGIRSKRSDAV